MTAAGLAPLLLHIKLTTDPCSTGASAPKTSVVSGRTEKLEDNGFYKYKG
jgi:hypothetical protein